MSTRKSNTVRLKPQPTQPKSTLDTDEVKRVAEKLTVFGGESIALLVLLFTHLENQPTRVDIVNEIYTIKKHLFLGTGEADSAQEKFQADTYSNRGKLLLWTHERSAP